MHSCCGTFSAVVLPCALCHSLRMLATLWLFLSKGTDTSYKPHEDRTVQHYPASLQLNYQSSTRKDEADQMHCQGRIAKLPAKCTCFLIKQSVVPHAYNIEENGAIMRMESQGLGTQSWAIGKNVHSDVHYKHSLVT